MTTPTVAEMLKYANLQMAAEALYSFNTRKRDPASLVPGDPLSLAGHDSGPIDPEILKTGNEHATRFAPTEAATTKGVRDN